MTRIAKVEQDDAGSIKYITLDLSVGPGYWLEIEGDHDHPFQALTVKGTRICVPGYARVKEGDNLMVARQSTPNGLVGGTDEIV